MARTAIQPKSTTCSSLGLMRFNRSISLGPTNTSKRLAVPPLTATPLSARGVCSCGGLDRIVKRDHLHAAVAFGQEDGGEVRVGDPGEAKVAAARYGPFGGRFGRLFHQLVLRHVEVQGTLAAGRVGDGQIAESAAPLDHVGQRLAVQRDLGGDHRKIARLLEAEDLAHADVPVGKLVGDAQAVRIGASACTRSS